MNWLQDTAAIIPLIDKSLEVYDLTTNNMIDRFTHYTGSLKWVLFSPYKDEFYTCLDDGLVEVYRKAPNGINWIIAHTFDFSTYGKAYSLNANLEGILIIAVNNTIIFYDLEEQEIE